MISDDDNLIELRYQVTYSTLCQWAVGNPNYMGGALRDMLFHSIVFPGHRATVQESISEPTSGECQDCDWTFSGVVS